MNADAVGRPDAVGTDPVGLTWLVTGRWTTVAAVIGAVLAGRSGLDAPVPVAPLAVVLTAISASNLWLWWQVRSRRRRMDTAAGTLVCVDVLLLSWLLLQTGGALNPASVFYLVDIVLVALVLGRLWAWVVAALAVAGYAALFLAPTAELRAAQVMHPEIGLHMRGMWVAFAVTAVIIAVLVTRLAMAVERRDRALEQLRDRGARASRMTSLTTAVAGAAHELSTPLATMAVAVRELERTMAGRSDSADVIDDARLIRAEIDRCRSILGQMAGRLAEPMGEAPVAARAGETIDVALAALGPDERRRVRVEATHDRPVLWPRAVVVQALVNVLRNAVQASAADQIVDVRLTTPTSAEIGIEVTDRGAGMTPDVAARAGEPFFTTKPGGTGLGLFVTRSSVDQLGGTVTVESAAGTGTRVTLILPCDVLTRPQTP